MRIYIVRHAEAKLESEDPERPLTERGRRQAEAAAMFLKRTGVDADVIFHSVKTRARQTAEIIKRISGLPCPLRSRDCLNPEDSPQTIYKELSRSDKSVMVVGHLPFVDRLFSLLICRDEAHRIVKFTECAVAVLEQDAPLQWQIAFYVSPDVVCPGI